MSAKRNILTFLLDSSSEESNKPLDEILFHDSDSSGDSFEKKLIDFCTNKPKRQRIRNFLEEIVPSYSKEEFLNHFRIIKPLYEQLCTGFESSSIYRKLRPDKRCSAEVHIAIFLWFAGHENCSCRDLADRFNMSTSTICRTLDRSIDYVSRLAVNTIKWPSEEEMEETSIFFQTKTDLPNVIGAIGITDITVDPQNNGGKEDKDSIYLQAICDEKKNFIDIFVAFPSPRQGSIFQNSLVCKRLKDICGSYRIVGDSTYPSTSYLITPSVGRWLLTASQKRYNKKVSSCHLNIKNALAILKQRFPQLYYCKLRGRQKLIDFVLACCVLHNLSDKSEFNFTEEENPTDSTAEEDNSP